MTQEVSMNGMSKNKIGEEFCLRRNCRHSAIFLKSR